MLIVGLTLSMGSVVLPTGTAIGDAFTLRDQDASSFLFTGVSGQFAGLVVTIPKSTIATQPVLDGNGVLGAGTTAGDTLAYSDPVVFYDTDQGIPTITRTITGPGTFTDANENAILTNAAGDVSVTFRAEYAGGGFTEVTSNAVTISSAPQITGPTGFADPQFDDATDTLSVSLPSDTVTVYAVLWNSVDPEPTITPTGFTGTFSQQASQAVSEGENVLNFPTLTDEATDRISIAAVLSDNQVTGVVTFTNTWPQSISLTEIGEGGENNYNGNPFSFAGFTLAESTTLVVSMGGRGSGFGQLSGIAFTGPNGEDQTIAVAANASQEASVDSGLTVAVGTLPPGTYNAIDPVGNTDAVTGFNFNVLSVDGVAAIVGDPAFRNDTLTAGEAYTLDFANIATGDAIVMAIGTRPGQGDGVERYDPVGAGAVEFYDSGTPTSGASSNTGSLYVIGYQAAAASATYSIGGQNTGTQQGGAAGVAVHLRKS